MERKMMAGNAAFGRYEIRGTLGEGGFATVYRAWDPALGREVALKALLPHLANDPSVRSRFLAEVRAVASLRHPNIVAVHDVGESGGRPFFTMEVIDGCTLAELIATSGPLDPSWVIDILRSLCSAVDYLHAAGLVHRDIKAANVMLDGFGRPVLMDFGIARLMEGTMHTRAGALLGTPESIAPEQIRGEPVGPPADIYALGVLAYQLLAGRPPFVGDTAYVLHAHVFEPPRPLRALRPELPAAVSDAVDAALEKDPVRRPARAGLIVERMVTPAAEQRPKDRGERVMSQPAPRPGPGQPYRPVQPTPVDLLVAAPGPPRPGNATRPGAGSSLLIMFLAACITVFIAAIIITAASMSGPHKTGTADASTAGHGTATIATAVSRPATPAPSEVGTRMVIARDNTFNVSEVHIPAGRQAVLTFWNQGSAIHNWHLLNMAAADGRDVGTGLIHGGGSETIVFVINTPGTYKFQCDVHPTEMTGMLVVQ